MVAKVESYIGEDVLAPRQPSQTVSGMESLRHGVIIGAQLQRSNISTKGSEWSEMRSLEHGIGPTKYPASDEAPGWNTAYSGEQLEGMAPNQNPYFPSVDPRSSETQIPENESEKWSGVRSRLDAVLGVLSGGRWSSTGGGSVSERPERDLNTGRQSSETRRRCSISQRSERKVEADEEPETLRRSLSGYFTASEDFSETDDETPKAGHSGSKL